MKKYILTGLFLINFALAFHNEKFSFGAGLSAFSQSYEDETLDGGWINEFEISCDRSTYTVTSGDYGCEYCVTYETVTTCTDGNISTDFNDACWAIPNCDDGNNNNNDYNNNSQCPGGGDPCSYCGSCYCNGDCQNPPETPKPKDCNGVEGGSAYTDKCGNCVGGNTYKTECIQPSNNPCNEINNMLLNSQIKAQYSALSDKLKQGTEIEWGTEIFAKYGNTNDWLNCTGSYTINVPAIRPGENHSFQPNWRDDYSSLNRMVGYMHIHPTDGTCFSPADIEVFLGLKSDPIHLETRSKDAIAMALTPSTNYMLEINDWTKLRDLDESVLNGLETDFMYRVTELKENQERVFMDLYVNSSAMEGVFNVFKTDSNGKPALLSTDANGNTISTPCN